jgi:hypothetical protein
MNLRNLVVAACNKELFCTPGNYIHFALDYLEFIKTNLQAVIVSRNENNYQFFQYKQDGTYNVTRPINASLMYDYEEFQQASLIFLKVIREIRGCDNRENRAVVNRVIYTAQQCIGATLDALPAKESNTARKINGDLFERFIRLIIAETGVDVTAGTISVPVNIDGKTAFSMNYQHDLILRSAGETKAIGSVKTSSKDRIDKIFIDKFLYSRLTDTNTPHFAVFLNDVQRKGKEGQYGINTTFLAGHFKGYTIKLTPLDGVYYCDIRPNMCSEAMLQEHIKTFDHFLFTDIWKLIQKNN